MLLLLNSEELSVTRVNILTTLGSQSDWLMCQLFTECLTYAMPMPSIVKMLTQKTKIGAECQISLIKHLRWLIHFMIYFWVIIIITIWVLLLLLFM